MSDNKFMARLHGEKSVKSVLEIKKYGDDRPFANMPNGSSEANVGTDTQINHGISYVRGTQVWKIDGSSMSVADNDYTGSGADKTGEVEVSGQGLWVDATYVFPNNLTEDTLAAVISAHPKFVVNLFGDNLFNNSNTQIDLTVLLKLGNTNLVAKTFSVMPQANFFHKQLEIGFDESIDDETYFEQGAHLTLQVICSNPTATARIYTGMSNLVLLNRKIDTNLVSPDFQDFDEWVYRVEEMDKKINNIIIKVQTMPDASTVEVGSVYVYMGETNPTYTHGYVYQNIVQEENTMAFSDDSISCDWTALSAFLARHGADYNSIAKGTMEYVPEANLWRIVFNSADDSVIFNYQQYTGDWEEAGFSFGKEFTSAVVVSFTRTTTQTQVWERMDVQPKTKWGEIGGSLLDQEDLKDALDLKQDKLIAGENITIDENNVISASGNVESVNGKTGVVVLTGEDIVAEVNAEADTVQGHLQTNSDEIDAVKEKIKEIELFKFPNATIIGEPTIQNGQVSGFSESSYLQFPFVVDLHNQPFQIDFCFTTGNNVTTQQNILDSQFGLALAIANGRGLMAISHNGTSWAGVVTGTMAIQPNTTYYARLSWNRINYKTELSTDGTTYVADMNFGSTQSPYPRTMFIGGCSGSVIGHTAHPFGGTINLNYSYLTVSGNVIWQGMDDAGLATRADVSLDNLDEFGQAKFDAKQNKLIAGQNITIDETTNTISATGGESIENQNTDSEITKIYNWVGTLAEYQAQNIETLHPDWVCYITDDVSGGDSVYTKAQVDALLAAQAENNPGFCSYNTNTRIPISTTTQTATKNGWLMGSLWFSGNNVYFALEVDGIEVNHSPWASAAWGVLNASIPLKAGQTYRYYGNGTVEQNHLYFYPNE